MDAAEGIGMEPGRISQQLIVCGNAGDPFIFRGFIDRNPGVTCTGEIKTGGRLPGDAADGFHLRERKPETAFLLRTGQHGTKAGGYDLCRQGMGELKLKLKIKKIPLLGCGHAVNGVFPGIKGG